jgi:hypothetical protein
MEIFVMNTFVSFCVSRFVCILISYEFGMGLNFPGSIIIPGECHNIRIIYNIFKISNLNLMRKRFFQVSLLAVLSFLIPAGIYAQPSSSDSPALYPEKKEVLDYLDRPEIYEKFGKISE